MSDDVLYSVIQFDEEGVNASFLYRTEQAAKAKFDEIAKKIKQDCGYDPDVEVDDFGNEGWTMCLCNNLHSPSIGIPDSM